MGIKETIKNEDGDHLCPSCKELHNKMEKPYYEGNMEYPIEVNGDEIHICYKCRKEYIIKK